MDRSDYTAAKGHAASGLLSGAQQHDKAVLTLAAGALGLSISFVRNIAPNPSDGTLWMLAVSWLLFLLAITSTLASFQTSIHAFRRHDKILDLIHGGKDKAEGPAKNSWITATLVLNLVSPACFIFGAMFLATFSYTNLGKQEILMSSQNEGAPKNTRGAVPPQAPVAQGEPGNAGAVPPAPPVDQAPNSPSTPPPQPPKE